MMKFKDFEGSPDEINNFFQNNGLNLSNYLNITAPEQDKKADRKWIIVLIAIFVILNISICQFEQNSKFYLPITILALGALGCLIALIQLNYEKWMVSLIAGVSGLIILIVSFKILSPQETIKTVKDKSEQYLDSQTSDKNEKEDAKKTEK